MGGGDLNMKKSWHPILMKNQEKVWLKEKEALEEKKKLDQLRKEKEEERQLQELQRMQEEKTGKKRTDKLEWMYTTPATGSAVNENELEDYLLGKKRVDKILTADDNAKLGASHKNFIAVQNANSARDISAKLREDPLFAIKQQEAAAYEALMSNPLKLKELKLKGKDKKDKKREKKERKARERALRDRERSLSPADGRRSYSRRSPSPYDPQDRDTYHRRDRSPYDRHDHYSDRHRNDRTLYSDPEPFHLYDSYSSRARRSSPSYDATLARGDHRPPWPLSDDSESPPLRGRSRSPLHTREGGSYGRPNDTFAKRSRSRSASPYDTRKRVRMSPSPRTRTPYRARSSPHARSPRARSPPRQRSPPRTAQANDRAARLAAMTSNASKMEEERRKRLTAMLEREKEELAAEEAARAKSGGVGGFLSAEQKKVFGGSGGLEDRLKRGRAGLVAERD